MCLGRKTRPRPFRSIWGLTSGQFRRQSSGGDVPEDVDLVRKAGSGRPKKTGEQVAKALRRSVTKKPAITAKELKQELPELLSGLSVRTIQCLLLVGLKMPRRKAAKKPLITDKM